MTLKSCCWIVAAGLVAAATAVPASADPTLQYKPSGHLYAPGTERLPAFESREYRIDQEADILASEIYHKQREDAILEGELDRLIQHDLSPGTDFRPRY